MRFKFWVARSRYDQPDAAFFAGQTFNVEVQNPKGEKVFTKQFTADKFGGFDGSFELPSDAALGVYHVIIPDRGGGSFRVEEYKKPEFEVSVDAPTKPVMLGEKVAATIKANYYFGGPVTEARVKYKITRTTADDRWYPRCSVGLALRPGILVVWHRVGVVSRLVELGHAPACGLVVGAAGRPARNRGRGRGAHPARRNGPRRDRHRTGQGCPPRPGPPLRHHRRDHRPVAPHDRRDRKQCWWPGNHSRSTRGSIAATTAPARRSKQVSAPRRSTIKPVAGKGTLKLLKIAYDADRKPVETPVESWDLALNAEGQARQVMKAAAPGQYRLSATVDDGQGHRIEGGYLLTITGPGFDSAGFRYNDLEIIPERKEYQPGDTLRLLINTNQVNSTVLLFVRPSGGIYLPPKVVHLRGKSTVEEIGIVKGDMPNMFVEALTVSGGQVHDEAREIAVPPESRIAQIQVEPSQTIYKPGEKAQGQAQAHRARWEAVPGLDRRRRL